MVGVVSEAVMVSTVEVALLLLKQRHPVKSTLMTA